MKKVIAIILALVLLIALAVPAFAEGPTPADPIAQATDAYKIQFLNMAKELLTMIVTAVFGYLGLCFRKLYNKYVDTAEKKAIVKDGVYFVEQVYTDIHGRDKLDKAFAQIAMVLGEKGIPIGEAELWTMVEAAVLEMNRQAKQEVAVTE